MEEEIVMMINKILQRLDPEALQLVLWFADELLKKEE